MLSVGFITQQQRDEAIAENIVFLKQREKIKAPHFVMFVKNYLEGRILFSDIPKIIEKILSRHKNSIKDEPRVNDILEAERWAREETKLLCSR